MCNIKPGFQLGVINQFPDCFVYVINFPGFDINIEALSNPFVLLRYFSFFEAFYLYPVELSPYNINGISNFTSENQVTTPAIQTRLQNNSTLSLSQRKNTSATYLDIVLRNALKWASKNCHYEVHIYLQPPRPFTDHVLRARKHGKSY